MENLYELLEKNEHAKLREELVKLNVVDIAEFIGGLPDEKIPEIFRILPKSISSDVFSYMEHDQQEQVITSISDHEISEIMHEMFTDDAVDFLEEMPAGIVKRVLAVTDSADRAKINEFLQYEEETGGALMTSEYVEIDEDTMVEDAIKLTRKFALDKETVYNLYITQKDRKLLGRVPLRTLLANDDKVLVKDIMTSPTVFAYTTDDQESIAQKMRKYDLISIPIVDREERLCGIITIDDAMDIITQEHTEDLEIMAALTPSTKPYLQTGVLRLSGNRIVWLLVLMISATVSSLVLQGFDDVLAQVLPLTFFIPMIIDTGGNAGSQASALVIRGLALGDIKGKDVGKVMWKELRIALLCGVILAVINFGRILIMDSASIEAALYRPFDIAMIVSITLVAVVILAKITGCLLPIAAQKLKMDPAVMAGPLITTVVDAFGLIIYFIIAKIFLGI